MKNEALIKNFNAAAALDPYRLIKFGTTQTDAALAVDGTATLLGVTDSLGADAAGDPVDVVMGGVATVVYGGTVALGDPLTADAQGAAIKAATAGQKIIGYAAKAGEAGDYGSVIIDRSAI